MLYGLLHPWKEFFFGFNVLRYITFRAAMASIFAFAISVVLGPVLVRWLKGWKLMHGIGREGFSEIRERQKHKELVPTMGGLLIIGSVLFSCLLWGDLTNRYLWIALGSLSWLGFIGFLDDALKLFRDNAKGLAATTKLTGQLILGLALGVFLYFDSPDWWRLGLPFFKSLAPSLDFFYIPFVCLVLVGTSNAVNLTDGLDGLAVGCSIIIALTYSVLSYVTGHAIFSEYLYLPFIHGTGELTVFCASLVGAGMGFLWFNAYPASVFMGDTGSLALGGGLGVVAVLTKKEILLLLVGGIFVFEALSVILQVLSYKLRGKRIFLMAPIHHHFQLKGWPESKIVIRFWIVSVILALSGLATLKLR